MTIKSIEVDVWSNNLLAGTLLIAFFPFISLYIDRIKYFYGLQGSLRQTCSVIVVGIYASTLYVFFNDAFNVANTG